MSQQREPATVHLLCGLNGAGKSTFARRLERDGPAVRFTLDEWMLRLHGLRYDHPEYPRRAQVCQDLIWDVAQQVLATGADVVLDWNLWNRQRRRLWVHRTAASGYRAVLYYVRVSVETAIERAEQRRQTGTGDAHVLDAGAIRRLARIFEPPAADEGLHVVIVDL